MSLIPARFVLIALPILVAAALLPLGVSGYILWPAHHRLLLRRVFSMAWDLLFGFAGEVNFGPTFLIGLGAYGAASSTTATGSTSPSACSRARRSPSSAASPWRCRP